MNGALGRRRYGLRSTLLTVKPTPSSRSASPRAPVLVEQQQASSLSRPSLPKSRPFASRRPSRATSGPSNDSGSNVAFDIPPAGADEGHPLALALHDQACRHGLDAAGGEPARDLAPEDGRDLVAVQAVEDPPGLLRVDQAHVDLPRLLERALDRRAGDLVEDHPPDRHLRLQHLDQVPGDGLALAILVRREQELLRVGQPLAQLADLALLVGVDDVQRLEVVLDVDAETRPGLLLELVRNLLRAGRQVANVADGGIDHEVVAEVRGDRPRLRRGLDDHQPFACFRCCHERMTLATVSDRLCAENASDTPKRRVTAILPPVSERERDQMSTAFYYFVGIVSWPVLRLLYRLRWRGRENVPPGGIVLASNHHSNFDPWPLGYPLWPKRRLRWMGKSELFNPIARPDPASRRRLSCPARDERPRGDRARDRARARGRHRRHVPGGHASQERPPQEVQTARAHGCREDRDRRGRPARAGRRQGNRPARAARSAARRLRRARGARRPRRA